MLYLIEWYFQTTEVLGKSSEMRRRSSQQRSDTLNKSPGVSDMLSGINGDMSDQEMKSKLMDALDKRVQEKHNLGESTTQTFYF